MSQDRLRAQRRRVVGLRAQPLGLHGAPDVAVGRSGREPPRGQPLWAEALLEGLGEAARPAPEPKCMEKPSKNIQKHQETSWFHHVSPLRRASRSFLDSEEFALTLTARLAEKPAPSASVRGPRLSVYPVACAAAVLLALRELWIATAPLNS